MGYNAFAEYNDIFPLVTPVDTTTTTVESPFVALKDAHRLQFLVLFGSITSTSTDQVPVITLEAATASVSTTVTALAFDYRKSAAVGTNTWGAKTAATSAGLSMVITDDDMAVLIELDPAAVQAAVDTATYVRVIITPNAGASACEVAVVAIIDSRYHANVMASAAS